MVNGIDCPGARSTGVVMPVGALKSVPPTTMDATVMAAEDGFERLNIWVRRDPGSVVPKLMVAPAIRGVDPFDMTAVATTVPLRVTEIVFTRRLAL